MEEKRKKKIVGVAVISGVILVSVTVGTIRLAAKRDETEIKTYATTNIANYNSTPTQTIDGIRYNLDASNRTATAMYPDNISAIAQMPSDASLNGVIGYSNSSGVWIDIPQVVTYNNTEYTVTAIGEGVQSFISTPLASLISSVSNKNLSIILPRTVRNVSASAFVLSSGTSAMDSIKIINLSNETTYGSYQLSSKIKFYAVPGSGIEKLTTQATSLYSYTKSGSNGNITITGFNNGVFDNIPTLAKVNIQLPDFIYENGSSTQKGIKFTVNKISSYAFNDNDRLKNIIIPANIKSIETEAFGNCDNVEIVKFLGKDKNISDNAFLRTNPSNVYYIGNGTVGDYVSRYMSTVSKTPMSLNSFEVMQSPTRTSYQRGESYDGRGGIYKLVYTGTDGNINTCYLAGESSDITYSPSTFNTTGTQYVSATYEGKTIGNLVAIVSDTSQSHVTIQTNQNITIEVGKTQEITPSVIGASDTRLDWSSGNPNILSVSGGDNSASITGLNTGTTTLTIRLRSDSNTYIICKVTVVDIEGKTIKMNQKNVILDAGEQRRLSCTTEPSNATVTWEIYDKDKKTTIDSAGLLTAGNEYEDGVVNAIINKDDFDKYATDTCKYFVGSRLRMFKNISKTEDMFNQERIVNRTGTLTTDVPTREGYKFKGWALGKDKNKKVVGPGERYNFSKDDINIIGGSFAAIDLYAIWQNVELDNNTYTMEIGKTAQVNAKVLVNEIQNTNERVTYEIANTDIATINSNGLITGKKAGTTTVKVKDTLGNEVIAKVRVDEPTVTRIAITAPTKKEYLKGESLNLEGGKIKVFYSNDTEKEIPLTEISDKISGYNANITGTQTITVTYDGQSNTFNVEVKEPIIHVNNVTLNKTSLNIEVGQTDKLEATINPENASNKNVEYSSSNPEIVTVEQDGTIRGIKAGTATITVTTEDGNHTATCNVAVEVPIISVEGIEITNKPTTNMNIGNEYELNYEIRPENATDKNVTWSSTDENVVYVDSNTNKLIANGEGTATITITTRDGNYTDSFEVTVNPEIIHVDSITLDKSSLEIKVEETYKLEATINPENASNKNITYSSSNTEVATVDENGTVTGISKGTATITVTTQDGAKTATCNVTVKEKARPVITNVEAKIEDDINYIVYISITDESGVKSVKVADDDITLNKTDDGRYYFKPNENGTYTIKVINNDGNSITYNYEEKGLKEQATADAITDSQSNNVVGVSPKTNHKVSKITVEGKEINLRPKDGKYLFTTEKNGTYNIVITYEDGETERLVYEETRFKTNGDNDDDNKDDDNKGDNDNKDDDNKGDNGNKDDDNKGDNGNKDDNNKGDNGNKGDNNKGDNDNKGNNSVNNGNSSNNNSSNGSNNSGNKISNNSSNSAKTGTKTDTSTALKTLPKTGTIISQVLATITGVATAIIAWFKMKK